MSYSILDAGCGDKPIKEADLLCDLYVINNFQRSNAKLVTNGREFVHCSIEDLPFRNRSIKFIYCNRVLEYSKNPNRAVNEMKRVGESGYFSVPSLIFPNFIGAYNKKNKVHFNRINRQMVEILPVKYREFFIFRFFTSLINLFTGIFQTEFFWCDGLEYFARIYKSNTDQLNNCPLFFVKAIVKLRKNIEVLRDKIIV